jgi:uncharacterized protein with HEPN domain
MKAQKPHLKDILIAIDKIDEVANTVVFDVFMQDYKIHDVVMYNFIIVGEASNRISDEFKQTHNSVEWHKLRGMRNHLAHSYDEIDYKVVWETIKNDLPQLKKQIQNIIQNL